MSGSDGFARAGWPGIESKSQPELLSESGPSGGGGAAAVSY